MDKNSKKFLYSLLETPSPTGFEEKIQQVVKAYVKSFADSIEIDYHGNLIAGINTKAKRRIMLAGHCDQIGLMVKSISKEGFIYVLALGGIDIGTLFGAHVSIHTSKGVVPGVVGRKPIHMQKPEERKAAKLELESVWIDIGAKDDKAAKELVEIGDPITYKLGVTELQNGLITAAGLDDRVGLFVAMEALRLCSEKKKLAFGVYAASTVQEEVGLRGAKTSAYAIDPEIGIAIDVTFATDNPGSEEKHAPSCLLSGGPVIVKGPNINPVVEKRLIAAAKSSKIPYQLQPTGYPLGNDANAIQLTKAGVATGSIGLPNRYMHTQAEVCSLKDLEDSAELLAEFIANLDDKVDLRPGSHK